MHLRTRVAATVGLLVLALAASLAAAQAASAAPARARHTDVVGHVYMDDNTVGTNTIGAFNRLADGSLVPMHGSPFVAGGARPSKPPLTPRMTRLKRWLRRCETRSSPWSQCCLSTRSPSSSCLA
jgi:hypothetical protein